MEDKPDASPAPLVSAEERRQSAELEAEERYLPPPVSPPPREIGLSFRRSASLQSEVKSDLESYQSVRDTNDLVIRFKGINVTADIPEQAPSYETFGKKFLGCFLAPLMIFRKKSRVNSTIKVLDDVSGYVMPGSMTLVLGPTGSGKSTLLKVLGGHFQASKEAKLDGQVLYNDSTELQKQRPVAYVTGLHNVHLPFFTVRETLQFAEECSRRVRPQALTSQLIKCFTPDLMDAENPYLEYILQAFGLKYIENFMLGMGEADLKESARVRLTTAEIAMHTFSVMLYDQPVTAEDSLRLYDRLHNLLNTVIRLMECAVVTCLVQVSPEVFQLFDRIILLSEGQVIYQGPRQCVESYFSKLGFERPAYVDPVVFLQDIATGSGGIYRKSVLPVADLVASYKASDHFKDVIRIVSSPSVIHAYWVEVVSEIELSVQDSPDGSSIIVTRISDAEEMATNGAIRVGDEITAVITSDGGICYVSSSNLADRSVQAHKAVELLNSEQRPLYVQLERKLQRKESESLSNQTGKFSFSDWLWSTRCVVRRQITFTLRFKLLYILRFFQIIVLGLFAGTMFYKKGGKIDQFEMISLRTIGFISMMNLLLINFIQLPVHLLINRPVFQKHQEEKLYGVYSYVVAHSLVNIPQSFLEAFIYSMCTYFLAGLSLVKAAHYFQYLALIFFTAYMGSSFVFLVGGFAPLVETAMAIAGLFTLVCILFSGVILIPRVVPEYWRWMLYISPMRWGNIIFSSTQMKDRYPQSCRNYPNFQFCLVAPQLNVGKAFLRFYQLEASPGRLILSYGAILIFTLALNILAYFAYKKSRMPNLVTTSARSKQQVHVHVDDEVDELSKAENGSVKQEAGWTSLSLPVRPLVLTFYELSLHSGEQALLRHVTGYAKPGQMLALIGSTRAGKTTLLKCLAGRAGGKLEGTTMVNGVRLKKTCFHRISGFAEKVEYHQPYLTVRESLEFSANLRLRRHVSPADRSRHVDLVLELTGLSEFSNQLVGSFQQFTCRTKETTKKLSFAVELAANPSILFLDDPTSQLDGIGTRNVLHMLRAVALNGRTLVFSLHHPSGETLSLFDNVLVLRQGEQVYFGPPGRHGSKLLEYFTGIPGVPAYDGKRSPVVFMLDILGGGTWKREPVTDFPAAYRGSPLSSRNSAEVEALQSERDDQLGHLDSRYIAPLTTQITMVFLRNARFLYRNVRYTFGRLTGIIIIALVMGTLFLNIDMERSTSMQSGSLIMYIQAILICATTANNLIPQLGTDRQVYVRESRARMYASVLYPLSWLASEIPYLLLATLVFVGIANGMAGIGVESFSMFIRYSACLFLFTVVIVCYGIFLACAAPLPMIGVTFASIFMSVWISSSGISVPRNHIKFYKWLYWLDPFQYTMNILIPTAFYCDTKSPACLSCSSAQRNCPGCSCKRLFDVEELLVARTNRTRGASFVWDRLLATRPIERDRNHWDYLALLAIAFFFAAIAAASFRFLKHNRAS